MTKKRFDCSAVAICQVLSSLTVEPHFVSACRLYERHGFRVRAPFADYTDDPLSVYYGLPLAH